VGSTVIPTLLWGDLANASVWLARVHDAWIRGDRLPNDYSKVDEAANLGLTAKRKFSFANSGEFFGVAATLLALDRGRNVLDTFERPLLQGLFIRI